MSAFTSVLKCNLHVLHDRHGMLLRLSGRALKIFRSLCIVSNWGDEQHEIRKSKS